MEAKMKKREICELIVKQGNCNNISCDGQSKECFNFGRRCPLSFATSNGCSIWYNDKVKAAKEWLADHHIKYKFNPRPISESIKGKDRYILIYTIDDGWVIRSYKEINKIMFENINRLMFDSKSTKSITYWAEMPPNPNEVE
jgi:hypothetical protein